MFIELTSQLTYGNNLNWLGVPIIAQGATVSRFTSCVLQIALKSKWTYRTNSESPVQVWT